MDIPKNEMTMYYNRKDITSLEIATKALDDALLLNLRHMRCLGRLRIIKLLEKFFAGERPTLRLQIFTGEETFEFYVHERTDKQLWCYTTLETSVSMFDKEIYGRIFLHEEPEYVHLCKSGFKNNDDKNPEWWLFTEDAHEQEPYRSGTHLKSETYIRETYRIFI